MVHNDISAETLMSYLEEVIELNRKIPILVEGKKDKKSLKELGFKGKMYGMNVGLPISELAEQIGREDKKIILLTDWDDTGERLFLKMKSLLMANDVKVVTSVRRDLEVLSRKYAKDVESLPKALEAMNKSQA